MLLNFGYLRYLTVLVGKYKSSSWEVRRDFSGDNPFNFRNYFHCAIAKDSSGSMASEAGPNALRNNF